MVRRVVICVLEIIVIAGRWGVVVVIGRRVVILSSVVHLVYFSWLVQVQVPIGSGQALLALVWIMTCADLQRVGYREQEATTTATRTRTRTVAEPLALDSTSAQERGKRRSLRLLSCEFSLQDERCW